MHQSYLALISGSEETSNYHLIENYSSDMCENEQLTDRCLVTGLSLKGQRKGSKYASVKTLLNLSLKEFKDLQRSYLNDKHLSKTKKDRAKLIAAQIRNIGKHLNPTRSLVSQHGKLPRLRHNLTLKGGRLGGQKNSLKTKDCLTGNYIVFQRSGADLNYILNTLILLGF